MDVLLTNDDGIFARGLRALHTALVRAGHTVHTVAPMYQQSGVGHSLTVFEPLRTKDIRDGEFRGTAVYGTPTDCVKLGLGCLVPQRPDLVIAGINHGPNSGPDIFYSGTVGAAAEAAHDRVASMAVSHGGFESAGELEKAARHAVALAERIDWHGLPPGRVVNVNYPACGFAELQGVSVCRQSGAVWRNIYSERKDPRGASYWWLEGDIPPESIEPGSDRDMLARGYVTITPLCFEYTDGQSVRLLAGLEKTPSDSGGC